MWASWACAAHVAGSEPGSAGQHHGAFTASQRPFYSQFPGVTDIYNIESNGYANFHSLQSTLVKRMGHGVSLQANYTWEHALGDNVGFSAGGLFTSADPLNTKTVEYGNSELDVRDRFAMMLNYRAPFGEHLHGVGAVVRRGGSSMRLTCGRRVSRSPSPTPVHGTNTGVGTDRPNQLRVPHVATKTLAKWFDTTAFAPQPLGTLGTTRRNSVYGPSLPPFRCLDLQRLRLRRAGHPAVPCRSFQPDEHTEFRTAGFYIWHIDLWSDHLTSHECAASTTAVCCACVVLERSWAPAGRYRSQRAYFFTRLWRTWMKLLPFVLCLATCAGQGVAQVATGIDVLEQQHFAPLRELATRRGGHLRLGVLTNPVGIDAHERRTIDVLRQDAAAAVPGLKSCTLFSAEHGINAAVDKPTVDNDTDAASGLPILSIYGSTEEKRHPSKQQLAGLDAVVIDLQDVGVRYWTFQALMQYFLRGIGAQQHRDRHSRSAQPGERSGRAGSAQHAGPRELRRTLTPSRCARA